MRMAASWFGSLDPPNTRLWRDSSAPKAGSPLIVAPTTPSLPSCSKPSRRGVATPERAAGMERRPSLTAPARVDLWVEPVGAKKRPI